MVEYSHSRLSTFEDCPRKFFFRYVEQVKVETEGVEAFMGKRVHEILERLYHHVARHGKPPTLFQVLERFRQDWGRAWHDKVTIVRTENSPEFYRDRGERCLASFYRKNYPFSEGETIAIEQRLQWPLDSEGRYRAVGIVDRIVRRRDGVFEIHDYKTGGYLPPQARIDEDRQLGLYQIGLSQTYSDAREVELVWHYLVFDRTLRSRRSPEALEKLRDDTLRLIDQIEGEQEWKPQPSQLCRWCDYAPLCSGAPEELRPAVTGLPPQQSFSSPQQLILF